MLAKLLQLLGLIVVVVLLYAYFDSSSETECVQHAVKRLEQVMPGAVSSDALKAQARKYCRVRNK